MLEQITLHNFCGFRDFTVDISEFSLLIGPNNGGKTTILRAVKFCIDACHDAFIRNDQPHPGQFKVKRPEGRLQLVADAGGITDLAALHFGRDRMEPADVSLRFSGESQLFLHVECAGDTNNLYTLLEFGGVSHFDLDDNAVREVLKRLAELNAEFVPPPATITPVESVMHWSEVKQHVAQGKFAETWRNRLHWMNENAETDAFQRVVNRVRNCLGDVEIRPPRRGKVQPLVEIVYVENGVEYDIAAAGGGVRTILTLAAAIELSDAPILLFDEPESHLHSSIQRQVALFLQESSTPEKQIIVTSHAPDLIEETSVDSVVWIDRTNSKGEKCGEIGRALIDLGAVSHTQALTCIGASAVVFVEGTPDRLALSLLLEKCGKSDILNRIVLANLKGFGNANHLPGALEVIRILRNTQLSMAAILDADYTDANPSGSSRTERGVLYIRLPCKELENLLLMSPATIWKAVKTEAERRQLHGDENAVAPDEPLVLEQIIRISREDDIRETVKPQWMCRWAAVNGENLNKPGQLKHAESEFQQRWEDDDWRIRCCPGKEVLKRFRRWLQDDFSISLSISLLFDCYEPSEEIRTLMDALENHIT